MSTPESSKRPAKAPSAPQPKPVFANWPTFKILTPVKGKFHPPTDEWCMHYCRQTATGRLQNDKPRCYSLCLRKVFPHELRTLASIKPRRYIGPEGESRFPLPYGGQRGNLNRFFGEQPPGQEIQTISRREEMPLDDDVTPRLWDEGWYLWAGRSFEALLEHTKSMRYNLREQLDIPIVEAVMDEVWAEFLKKIQTPTPGMNRATMEAHRGQFAMRNDTLLVPLSAPDFPPVWEKIEKVLEPTERVLDRLDESIVTGELRDFARRVWEKAFSVEPFVLASRAFSTAYERWNKRDESSS